MNKYKEQSKASVGTIFKRVAGSATMCLRKTSFATEAAADKRAKEITEEGVAMRFYKCPHCYKFHLSKVKT